LYDQERVAAVVEDTSAGVVYRLAGCQVTGDPVGHHERGRARTGLVDLIVQVVVLPGDAGSTFGVTAGQVVRLGRPLSAEPVLGAGDTAKLAGAFVEGAVGWPVRPAGRGHLRAAVEAGQAGQSGV
jgi:hypothetical protein